MWKNKTERKNNNPIIEVAIGIGFFCVRKRKYFHTHYESLLSVLNMFTNVQQLNESYKYALVTHTHTTRVRANVLTVFFVAVE